MSQVRRQATLRPRPSWGWQDAAACRGEDLVLFFGPDGERQPEREIRERKAKEICAHCPVRTECLDYAISRPEKYGTWVDSTRTSARPSVGAGCVALTQPDSAAPAGSNFSPILPH